MENLSCYTFGISLLGAIGQEIMHWYHLKLELGDTVKLYKSSTYWIITIVSVLFFAVTSILLTGFVETYLKGVNPDTVLFVTAFAYPIIIKYVLKLIVSGFDTGIATKSLYNTKATFEAKDYFK
jgi:hypothetical protein